MTKELLAAHPDARGRLRAVGISGQGVAAVRIAQNRKPLRKAILWIDTRSAPQGGTVNYARGRG